MKDLFSLRSQDYQRFRPRYPASLYDYLYRQLQGSEVAWDCASGNGQVAGVLADHFQQVEATDISENQLSQAIEKKNIHYSRQPAEKTSFPDQHFDLITVAQAVHWFDIRGFYKEVKRVLKPTGLIAIMGYSLFKSHPKADAVIRHLYEDVLGSYWDPERRYLEEAYQSLPFPFEELFTPRFEQSLFWDLKQLTGYLGTWSAVKHYQKAKGVDPVALIQPDLKEHFGNCGPVTFPILFRLGKLY